jgi:predicted transcriptional regulator
MDFDEILIFFAIGRLNFDDSEQLMFVKPAHVKTISCFMGIPRATLQRKLNHIEAHGLVGRSSYGFIVKDLSIWRRLARSIDQDITSEIEN